MGTGKKSSLVASDYVHLHNHTHYSLLDGLQKVDPMLDAVVDMGMEAIAITDHGTLSGAIEFYNAARSRGVKPIIGMETYVASRTHKDKDAGKDKNNYHLILLAMNNQGYQNLMRLSTIANLEGFYYRPRVDHDLLEKYSEGIIVLSGCIGGEVGDNIRQGQYDKAKDIAQWYKSVFGDRYYLEIQDHGHPKHPAVWSEQTTVNQQVIKLGKELDIKVVVTCDSHYLQHEDQEAHEVLLCVQTGSFLGDEKRMSLKDFELHLTNPNEIKKRWEGDYPDFIANTKQIADRCDVTIDLGKILIPKFTVPGGETEKSYLHTLAWQGLAWRYGGQSLSASSKLSQAAAQKTLTKEIVERAKYELEIMDSMGFNGYFLIVQDFITWGKDKGIIFGPGRGSAAGSIIAYALRITEIEPLKYNLMFERFLNPSRISMPDIDIDIQDSRRNEVIEYCVNKYGIDRVANIVTFGRMAARNAVRDVARVLQVPYIEADRLAKMIPPPIQGRHIPLSTSILENQDLKREYESSEMNKRVFDLAIKLEGTIRSHGVHAAGVVIAPDDIVKFAPLEMAQKGVISTQYSMGPIEELGLLKMDFLGLSNLTIIKNALRIIKKVYKKDIELSEIPIDDEETFKLLQRADTTGVFQLESAGMKRYLKDLKPTLFEDIIAMGALYRPGPMSEIPRFIEGKNNPKSISYLHESLEPILKDTYGVMVYQEQIIKLLQLVAGYTPGEADLVRKAIGKKKRDIMEAEEPKFIEGCIKQGLSRADASKLWSQIQPFADYSFNKAHATCYAQISYWTAYLKAHYPTAFMAALMTSDYDDIDRLAIEIAECRSMGITVVPPDINESFMEFAVVPDEKKIRFGMQAIKNVGAGAVDEVLRARSEVGAFPTLESFFTSVHPRIVNRKSIESFIKTGAFDRYENRGVLLENIDVLLAFAAKKQKEAASGQTDLFGNKLESTPMHAPQLVLTHTTSQYEMRHFLAWERELLGLFLSEHPLQNYKILFEEQTIPIESLQPTMDGKKVVIGGIVESIRTIQTKNSQSMAFVKVTSLTGDIEVILFPSILQQTIDMWVQDSVVIIRGKLSTRDREGNIVSELKVIADEARLVTLEQAKAYQATGKKKSISNQQTKKKNLEKINPVIKLDRIYIRLSSTQDTAVLKKLKDAIDQQPQGQGEVVLIVGQGEQKQAIRLPNKVDTNHELINSLEEIFGAENVKR